MVGTERQRRGHSSGLVVSEVVVGGGSLVVEEGVNEEADPWGKLSWTLPDGGFWWRLI